MNLAAKVQRRTTTDSTGPTRDALLQAARVCVREEGIAGTTSRLIASTAEANLGAITYYFGSKDELIAEALFGELERRVGPVIDILEDADTPAPERLLIAMQEIAVRFDRSADDVPVYLHALVAGTRPGRLADRAQALLSRLHGRMTKVIARLVDDGAVAPWVDPDAMASLLVATANGMVLQTRLDPDGPHVPDMATQLAGLLLAAGTPGTDPRPPGRSPVIGRSPGERNCK